MSVDILAVIRDILVVAYMFVLRIGVPLIITLLIGSWLRRLTEEKEEKPQTVEQKEVAVATAPVKH